MRPLRTCGDRLVGSAVRGRPLVSTDARSFDAAYLATFQREFNLATPENELKFGFLQPCRGRYLFDPAEREACAGQADAPDPGTLTRRAGELAAVLAASRSTMWARGHTLIWDGTGADIPVWLRALQRDGLRGEVTQVFEDHITRVVRHFAATEPHIRFWDVVNEAYDDDGSIRTAYRDGFRTVDHVWAWAFDDGAPSKLTYVERAFRVARAALDAAVTGGDLRTGDRPLLFYNDHVEDFDGARANAIVHDINGMVRDRNRVPIDGVGLQTHVDLARLRREASNDGIPVEARIDAYGAALKTYLRRFDASIEIHITELDVRDDRPYPTSTSQAALVYERVLDACIDTPRCRAFTVWGFTDTYSWIPDFFPATPVPYLLFHGVTPDLAYVAVRRRMLGP